LNTSSINLDTLDNKAFQAMNFRNLIVKRGKNKSGSWHHVSKSLLILSWVQLFIMPLIIFLGRVVTACAKSIIFAAIKDKVAFLTAKGRKNIQNAIDNR